MNTLLKQIARCNICKNYLPLGPRPVVQLSTHSKIIIIGQAPGKKVHLSGIPWDDASGIKLRSWMGINEDDFYNAEKISIMPMGFCYPGKGISGDLSPRPECAPKWHGKILNKINTEPLILLVGQYAQKYYLKKQFRSGITDTVKNYQQFLPSFFPLPHPSPRNQNWLKINPWFEEEVLPKLKMVIAEKLQSL